MVVIEAVPAPVGTLLSQSLKVPVIAIGAGAGCDGQVLVIIDMLGLQNTLTPRYLKCYANLAGTVEDAARSYVSEVKAEVFLDEEHGYTMDPEEEAKL